MRPRLRLFQADDLRLFEGDDHHVATLAEKPMRMRLGDLLEVLEEAARCNQAVLRDFQTDDVQISGDLYEVLSTYLDFRPGA